MRKRTSKSPGLYWRADTGDWYIDKCVYGRRISGACKTTDRAEAEAYLARRVDEVRRSVQFGERPRRLWREAATKYLLENQHKKSIADDAWLLSRLDPYIGGQAIDAVHQGSLAPFIADSRKRGNKANTINLHLSVARRICNLAASLWVDDSGLTWIAHAPKFQHLPTIDAKAPRPISWPEQAALLNHLPEHLQAMAVFALNTGTRNQEVCNLRWDMEREVSTLGVRVFVIPPAGVKNREPRLVVLNAAAQRAVNEQRGKSSAWVFTYAAPGGKPRPMQSMYTSAWKKAVTRAGLAGLRVHDLKHTFGRRLRAAGVQHETRQALLGHTTGSITTHYSAPEIQELLSAAESVCARAEGVLLRSVTGR